MKETPAHFEQRTGRKYDPPGSFTSAGRALALDEACPTLFRYPGPAALLCFMRGAAGRLGPAGAGFTWFASGVGDWIGAGGNEFGVVAVLEPLHLDPCPTEEEGQWIGSASSHDDRGTSLWIPADEIRGSAPWDSITSAEEAVRAIRNYRSRMSEAVENVSAYLEELSILARAGAPGPDKPWCELSEDIRRELLHRFGAKPAWTGKRAHKT